MTTNFNFLLLPVLTGSSPPKQGFLAPFFGKNWKIQLLLTFFHIYPYVSIMKSNFTFCLVYFEVHYFSYHFLSKQEVAQKTGYWGHFSWYGSIRLINSCVCKAANDHQVQLPLTSCNGKFEFLCSCSLRNHDCNLSYLKKWPASLAMHIENRAKLTTSLFFEVGKCNVLPQQKAVQIKDLISG